MRLAALGGIVGCVAVVVAGSALGQGPAPGVGPTAQAQARPLPESYTLRPERIFDDLNLLVLEGDASALAEHVFGLSGARVTLTDSLVAAPDEPGLSGGLKASRADPVYQTERGDGRKAKGRFRLNEFAGWEKSHERH